MHNIRLQFMKEIFDLPVAYKVIQRTNGPNHFIDDNDLIFLILCLLEKFALRPNRRPGD
jgi:hypothetical protein